MHLPPHPRGVDSVDGVPETMGERNHGVHILPGILRSTFPEPCRGKIIDPQGFRVLLPFTDDGKLAKTLASDQYLLDHDVLGDLDSVFGHGASATLADGLQLAGIHIFCFAEKRGVLNAISPA